MALNTYKVEKQEESLVDLLIFRFAPYWPLFLLLILVSSVGAWAYLQFTTPMYSASAKILLKEKKGADDARLLESLNIYGSKKTVENEIEVIGSRTLMAEVVNRLHLYAPIVAKDGFRYKNAYGASPVTIELREPNNATPTEDRVPFTFNRVKNQVVIGKNQYPVGEWVNTAYGVLKFNENLYGDTSLNKDLFFTIVKPNSIAGTLAGRLTIEPTDKVSTVLNLTYVDEVPKRAEDILNAVIESYTNGTVNEKNALATNTLSFIDERLRLEKKELEKIEGKIEQYKSQQGIVDLSEQSRVFLQNVSNNDRKVSDINEKLAVLDAVQEYLTSKTGNSSLAPSTLGLDDNQLTNLLQRLYNAEQDYGKLKETMGENSPALTAAANEIEKLRPTILETVRNQRKNLQASRTTLVATNSSYTAQIGSVPQKERELLEISRQQSIKNGVYQFLLQKREETALASSSIAVADSRVIDAAQSGGGPVSPNRLIAYLMAVVLAVVITVIFVTWKELLTGKILFRADIEKFTQVPIVTEITSIKHKGELVVNMPDKIFISEQFRQLRAAIGLYGKTASKKKILVTSSISGEGKSFVAANLALSLALSGKKVVLVDADLRGLKTSAIFDLENEKGLAEYLQGTLPMERMVKNTSTNNLAVIPAGGDYPNPTELLINGRLTELFSYLEKSFDYILIDTSPIDPVTDAYVLSEYCDRTLFVIRHGYTPKAMVQLLDENNKIKALHNLAIVFNGVKKRGFIKGNYGFGYGFGYEYVYKEREYTRANKIKTSLN
ncbi:MAG TPA: polysaccharide biosynthesis tyrosine autokinase [Chitinophagaceae bacterium]|nr:polysaccharide biosynthesis tyrosine autokinase [Chitinophagaceae bacterium]